ncbi:Os10g0395601 [Oryza sativa Japonica Group]|uniref:Os10g0395601 protein n=2 Tax=Oryza TaxID=4527 RepID=A0A0P0XTS1_ORYSJ|nr:Os10g0395601 [Oryza sativa Japonica Group]
MAVGSCEVGGALDQSPSCAAAAEEGKLSAVHGGEAVARKRGLSRWSNQGVLRVNQEEEEVIPAQSDGELSGPSPPPPPSSSPAATRERERGWSGGEAAAQLNQ